MGFVFYNGGIMRDEFETGKIDSSLLEYACSHLVRGDND